MTKEQENAVRLWMKTNYFFFSTIIEMVYECAIQFGHPEWKDNDAVWNIGEKVAREDLNERIPKIFSGRRVKKHVISN